MALQLPCFGSTTQSPRNFPLARNSAATGALSRPAASLSTTTIAKRRDVSCSTSDCSVRRRCCGRRKLGMHTTISVAGSNGCDVTSGARAGSVRSEVSICRHLQPLQMRQLRPPFGTGRGGGRIAVEHRRREFGHFGGEHVVAQEDGIEAERV